MSRREEFTIAAAGGELRGWREGSGDPVLLLHGGPGLSAGYLDPLAHELSAEFDVASFQQRGLAPSTLEGPFTVAQAIADVLAVADGLGWMRPLVVGHSWGGHLAIRVLAAHPARVRGALAVDPLGVAGDGGMAGFEAEMFGRTPAAARARAAEIDAREKAGAASAEESLEALGIFWPCDSADPFSAPPASPMELSVEAFTGLIAEALGGLDELHAALRQGITPYGVIAGAASPIPWGQAAYASVELSPAAWLEVVPAAGHFVWHEAPGAALAALRRLNAS